MKLKRFAWGLVALAALSTAAQAQASRPPSQRTGPITITGPGSTGDVSRMSVAPDVNAPAQSLAKTLYSPTFPGPLTAQGKGGYWLDRPGGANIQRMGDRLFIGPDASAWEGNISTNGVTWPWTMGKGIFGYLPRNAQVWASSPFGQIGILSSAQTADSVKLPGEPTSGCCAIPFASLVRNNNSSKKQPAWGYYSTAVREAGSGETHNLEMDIANVTSSVVRIPVYGTNPDGYTLNAAFNSGGEAAPYNNPSDPPYPTISAASGAAMIGSNGSTFDKGFIFKSGSLSPTADGATVPIDMPAGYSLRWVYDSSDVTGSFVNSFISGPSTQMGISFQDSGMQIQNLNGSKIFGKFGMVGNPANFPLLTGAESGASPRIEPAGPSANIDFQIQSKGTGSINMVTPAVAIIGPSGTCIHAPGTSAEAVSCFSDERLKKDIVDAKSGLDFLDGLRIRDFALKSDGSKHTGVIAQEAQKVHPEMVSQGADGMLMVQAPNPWIMVKAIQELRATQTVLAWACAGLGAWCLALTVGMTAMAARRRAA